MEAISWKNQILHFLLIPLSLWFLIPQLWTVEEMRLFHMTMQEATISTSKLLTALDLEAAFILTKFKRQEMQSQFGIVPLKLVFIFMVGL